jgi:ketosteroid isomerase-like protein
MNKMNTQLLKEISRAFASGNFEYATAYLAEDVVLEVSKMVQLQSFPLITIKNIVAEGNYVVVESTGQAKTKNGNPYNQTYCDVFRFKDEKLQEITTYLDTALSNTTA